MSEHIQKTIEDAQKKLSELEAEVLSTKKQINWLCGMAGKPPMFQESEAQKQGNLFAIRSDQFFGKPLATVAKEYLELRKSAGLGAASLDEIFETLTRGGYDFGEISGDAKRGLAISMAKNSVAFFKLPNGNWGLASWYPEARHDRLSEANGNPTKRGRGRPKKIKSAGHGSESGEK